MLMAMPKQCVLGRDLIIGVLSPVEPIGAHPMTLPERWGRPSGIDVYPRQVPGSKCLVSGCLLDY
jgi:hypothetical protein